MSAIAVFKGPDVYGTLTFKTENNIVRIYTDLSGPGLIPNKYQSFYFHEYGDIRNECKNIGDVCSRHLLNIDVFGNAKYSTSSNIIQLSGPYSIIGKSIIIYQNCENCGNAGKRIACAVIGIAND